VTEPTRILLVAAGGACGAVLRHLLSESVQASAGSSFPFGTLAVNLLGCLLAGAVLYLGVEKALFRPEWRLFLAVGVLGGFTTFSAFGCETFTLLRNGDWISALANAGGSVLLGLAGIALGWLGCRWVG